MEQKQNRDQWLEQAMAQWEVPLLRTCFLLLKDAALAEDAVQEAFIKAWRAYGTWRQEASEKAWLMRIAVNTCRDIQRSKWFMHTDKKIALEDLPEPACAFEMPDDTLIKAILSLSLPLRSIVVLKYYQGMSIGDIARATGISRRTVHYRLDKAERLLKSSLEEWYYA